MSFFEESFFEEIFFEESFFEERLNFDKPHFDKKNILEVLQDNKKFKKYCSTYREVKSAKSSS